jgi:NADH-quinone oxidoreductase subunit E
MSTRRLAGYGSGAFAFTPENLEWARAQIAKYPPGRQASAVIALLWRAQDQNDGWLPEPAIRMVADLLEMPYIRVYEIATFYTMFNLAPVGRHLVQVCTTTPCWLRGSDEVMAACKDFMGTRPDEVTADGLFSWREVECLGACVNAPMVQINADYYEDLDGGKMRAVLETLKAGGTPKPGPQNGRRASEPEGGPLTLTGTAPRGGEG